MRKSQTKRNQTKKKPDILSPAPMGRGRFFLIVPFIFQFDFS